MICFAHVLCLKILQISKKAASTYFLARTPIYPVKLKQRKPVTFHAYVASLRYYACFIHTNTHKIKLGQRQYSSICKSGFMKEIRVILIFGVIKIILVRGVTECTNNAANFEF